MKTAASVVVFALPLIAAQLSYVNHHYSHSTGTLYRFHRECRNFEKAKWTCEQERGHLVIINSDEEAAFLSSLFLDNPPELLRCEAEIYIGVHFNETLRDFRSFNGDTLEEAGYAVWAPGEPNNQSYSFDVGEQCVTMFQNKELNDLYCGMRRPFVCEISGYVYSTYTASLYKFYQQLATPLEARTICKTQGGHLAAVNDAEEAELLTELFLEFFIKYQTVAIVGSHYDSVGLTTLVAYNEKSTTQRNDNPVFYLMGKRRRRCIAMDLYGLLLEVDCAQKHMFICEVDRLTNPRRH